MSSRKIKTANNCLNCFPNSKIVPPSLHFLRQGIWKPILCRHQTFILGKFRQGLDTVFPLSICDAFCCKHILSICMKYMYGVYSWTKSSIRHVERHVVTFPVRRNFAIRQRSNSSRRLPSLTSCVSLRCVAHFTRCIIMF